MNNTITDFIGGGWRNELEPIFGGNGDRQEDDNESSKEEENEDELDEFGNPVENGTYKNGEPVK